MTPEEFNKFYPPLADWINRTLVDHAESMRSVASAGFPRLPLYFSQERLLSTKFVTVERLPLPPLSAMGLAQFAGLERGEWGGDGITYLDTFFVRTECVHDESIFFHEMIYVIQWELLGPELFLKMYAVGLEKYGYKDSPLEDMAYRAQAAFSRGQVFDAARWVSDQLSPMLVG